MEVERQRYAVVRGEDGKVEGEHKIGNLEKFEFRGPGDAISQAVGGDYITLWNGDFLQRELGKEGTCARLYLDKRVAVDIADPDAELARKKRKLLHRNGFGYMCIPPNFPQEAPRLRSLYNNAVETYRAYEKVHPRPAVMQETIIIDKDGQARRALLTAIDTKVGGGFTGNVESQRAELKSAHKLKKSEVRNLKLHSKALKLLRRSIQEKKPLRNPFISRTERLYPFNYTTAA